MDDRLHVLALLLLAAPLPAQGPVQGPPTVPPSPAGAVALLSQPVDHVNFKDAFSDLTMMSWGTQIIADDFVVSAPGGALVTAVRFWGGLYKDVYVGPDHFSVEFYGLDANGLPGNYLGGAIDVQPQTLLTGWVSPTFTPVKEIRYTLPLSPPVALPQGTFWVAVYNNTPTTADTWTWFGATIDEQAGVPNHAFQSNSGQWWHGNLPPSPWPPKEFSLEIRGLELGDLAADVAGLSLAGGGTQKLSLAAGAANAGKSYLVLGSALGTSPGLGVDAVVLPLNLDAYTLFCLANVNSAVLSNTFGALDAAGKATATVNVPPASSPLMAGATLHHAYLLFSPTFTAEFASVPASLNLFP